MRCIFLLFAYCLNAESMSLHPKLLVVSFDGFRNDYLLRNLTPTFETLGEANVRAEYVQNVFPTKTYSNHFTMATGLYSETTGIIGNSCYDVNRKTVVSYGYDLFHHNNSILPIWLYNEEYNSSRHSGTMMWPGGEFQYRNKSVTFQKAFQRGFPWKERVDIATSWFRHATTPANLVLLYFEEPDSSGHRFGPNSNQVNQQLVRADSILQYLMSTLKKYNLDDVNVVLLSDHGLSGVTIERIIDLKGIVGDHESYGESPLAHIYPDEGKENLVYRKLNEAASEIGNFRVFKRDDIPEELHYRKSTRAPPILAIADNGYAFQDLLTTIESYNEPYTNTTEFGEHGYDTSESNMHPYFIALGPAFKKNHRAGVVRTVDFFSLFAHILGLNSSYPTEGHFSEISHILL